MNNPIITWRNRLDMHIGTSRYPYPTTLLIVFDTSRQQYCWSVQSSHRPNKSGYTDTLSLAKLAAESYLSRGVSIAESY